MCATRKINGVTWADFNGSFWEPVPRAAVRMRIAHHKGNGFVLYVYRHQLGDRRNCIGAFKTFKQAAIAAA